MDAQFTSDFTKVSIDYGSSKPIFTLTIKGNEPLIEEASEEAQSIMRKRMGIVSLGDLDWKNLMVLESLCRIYYEVVTGIKDKR